MRGRRPLVEDSESDLNPSTDDDDGDSSDGGAWLDSSVYNTSDADEDDQMDRKEDQGIVADGLTSQQSTVDGSSLANASATAPSSQSAVTNPAAVSMSNTLAAELSSSAPAVSVTLSQDFSGARLSAPLKRSRAVVDEATLQAQIDRHVYTYMLDLYPSTESKVLFSDGATTELLQDEVASHVTYLLNQKHKLCLEREEVAQQLLKVRALQIRAQIETMLLVAAGHEVGPGPHHIVSAASLLHVPHHRPPIGGAIHHLQCPQCPGLIEASRFAEHLEFHVNEVLFYLRIYRIDISLSL